MQLTYSAALNLSCDICGLQTRIHVYRPPLPSLAARCNLEELSNILFILHNKVKCQRVVTGQGGLYYDIQVATAFDRKAYTNST